MRPLIDARDSDPTAGGYGWLDLTDGGATYHPGIDYNAFGPGDADLGAPIVAIARMRLECHRYTEVGYGIHQYWRLLEGPFAGAHMLIAHLSEVMYQEVGSEVRRGETIARCGATGGYKGTKMWAHLHVEYFKGVPPFYGYWPKYKTKYDVEDMYHNPEEVVAAYDLWQSEEETMTQEERDLLEAARASTFGVSESTSIIRLVSALGANLGSITGWINEIGALKEALAQAQASYDPTAQDKDTSE